MRRSLQQQITTNKRASVVYAALLVLLLSAFGTAITGYYHPSAWILGALGSAILGLIVALVARYSGSKIVLSIAQARNATPFEQQVLDNVAEEMAIAAGIPKPRVMIVDDEAPNAFATGASPETATVVFTTGLIRKLNRDELQGVMAHEIAHIRNYDVRLMTMLAMVAGLIPMMADFFWRSNFWGGRRSSSKNDSSGMLFLILTVALAILAPIFAKMLELAVSRKREYLADASAAELTRYPEGLASALEKISTDTDVLDARNRATEHMYIVNPFRPREEREASLFSTHPPIRQRINVLRNLMGSYPPRHLESPRESSIPPVVPDRS
ncbi:MAG TPA: M48 family metallopeptidase [Fimbriimonadaceae bacterium]|nr:M48 family metallopeptidase [Fimbriimonadaceae bacterium]